MDNLYELRHELIFLKQEHHLLFLFKIHWEFIIKNNLDVNNLRDIGKALKYFDDAEKFIPDKYYFDTEKEYLKSISLTKKDIENLKKQLLDLRLKYKELRG